MTMLNTMDCAETKGVEYSSQGGTSERNNLHQRKQELWENMCTVSGKEKPSFWLNDRQSKGNTKFEHKCQCVESKFCLKLSLTNSNLKIHTQ